MLCGGNSSCNLARSPVYRAFCKAMSRHSSGDRRVGSQTGQDWDPQIRQAGAEGRHPRWPPQRGGELFLPGMASLWEREAEEVGLRAMSLADWAAGTGPTAGRGLVWEEQGAYIGHAINSPGWPRCLSQEGGLRPAWA